jgi:hypothetical protein
MSQAYIKVVAKENIAAPAKRPTDQPRHPPIFIVVITWSLAAAVGVAFWMLLLYHAVPTVSHGIPAYLRFIQQHTLPSAVRTESAEAPIR